MKREISIIFLIILCLLDLAGQTATNIFVPDTRQENLLPSGYSREAKFEFKARGIIGVPGVGDYSGLLTFAPWGDWTGNKVHQLNFNDGGIFWRTGSQIGNWENWKSLVFTDANGNIGIGTSNSLLDALQIGDFNNTRNLKINIPGVYNFEQIRLGQFGNGSCGLEFVNHTNVLPSYGVRFFCNTDNGINGLQIQTATPANSYQELNYSTKLIVNYDGNVGIGSNNPSARLHLLQNGGGWADGIRLSLGPKTWDMVVDSNGDRLLICQGQSSTGGITITNGNVGIGVASAQNKLDVNGTIRAKEIKVESGWADFVFHPSYQLKPLIEVERFIKANGHLQDIPSAAEVEQNGVNVGEMQSKLLQKVEEVTLYLIEQSKQLEALKKENELLKQENKINTEQLLKEINDLKSKLKQL